MSNTRIEYYMGKCDGCGRNFPAQADDLEGLEAMIRAQGWTLIASNYFCEGCTTIGSRYVLAKEEFALLEICERVERHGGEPAR
jgi:hypothetical protein